MKEKRKKIGIVGLWHLGCVLSAAWSKLGFAVIGFDHSKDIIDNLNQNRPPLFEPGLKEILTGSRKNKLLKFSDDLNSLRQCDFVFLAYDTPILDNDSSDLTLLEKTIGELKNILKDGAIVIISSQMPVGTCSKFRIDIQKINPTIELVYSPENLRLGEAIKCYLKPERIILGTESETAKIKTIALFSKIQSQIVTMNLASAEMVKHAINAFLANSIVFVNHLSDICEVSGANILDVLKGVKTDERIGERAYLSPGIGFSGGTLGRDLQVLTQLNTHSRQKALLFETLLKFNSERKNVIVDKIIRLLKENLSEKTIAILGITYKPGTSTLRRSLPLEITTLLAERGARIKVYDPKANYEELTSPPPFKICNSISEAISESNLIVLLTEWNEFREYDWGKGANLPKERVFFDTKNFLYANQLPAQGYKYYGIGI